MNTYALLPLIAVIAYVPLLATTISSRPWHKRNLLFAIFLLSAMAWSLFVYIFRGQFFLSQSETLFKIIVILCSLVGVQFHVFTSSFFTQKYNRWLVFSYTSLAAIVVMVLSGFVTGDVTVEGQIIHGSYQIGVIVVFLPLIALAARNFYVFGKMLKDLNDPVTNNQILSLILSVAVLTLFITSALLPWGKNVPISHFGNIVVAVILSYSVIRHRLMDIKLVIRQGTAWASLAIIGMLTFWLLLITFRAIFDFKLDLVASITATVISTIVAVFVYRLRGYLFELMGRAFQGSSYDYRQKLTNFSNSIHNIFSLKEQGGELLTLLTKAIGIKQACLLFPEPNNDDFTTQFLEPNNHQNKLSDFKLKANNPIIKYLERERQPLSSEYLSLLPIFLGLWALEKEEIQSREIEVLIPLISRDKLIAILVIGKKVSGKYSLEDLAVLEDVAGRVAVSIEKEYLREQLREREEELSVINRSSAIITSSLDIQEIFGSFIEELKHIIDVSWASIVLAEEDGLRCMALSSNQGSAYQVGETIPSEGTGTGWVIRNKRPFFEPNILKESRFTTGENFYKQGLRTVVYLPLISKGEAIGSLIIASREVEAYNQRHIKLLEQLASQIAMPLENAQLYARAEAKARIDELTGLLNRRTLDEMIDDEISRHSRYGGVFSLAILDLDSFKTYNDTYGHPEGDILLRQVGQVIKGAIRTADRAFRYGGDEFAILLPQTSIDDALQVTERVRDRISSDVNSGDIRVTASIGLANWPDDGVSHTDIIAAADVTLYRAKRSGGNQSFYTLGSLSPLQFIDSNKPVETSIDKKTLGIVHALAETIDNRSYCNCDHSKKVAEYALELGKALKLKSIDMSRLEISALLRDIGKVGISDDVLKKTDQLTPEEWEIIKTHPQLGATIAERVPQLSSCVDAICYHHEWYDGSGYPNGLKGESIPLEARILAVADAFAAMTSERPYASTLTHEEALKEIQKGAGKQFDPELAEIFISTHSNNLVMVKKTTRR
jgi:diguanylate cyclase (GGDEF)-like protein